MSLQQAARVPSATGVYNNKHIYLKPNFGLPPAETQNAMDACRWLTRHWHLHKRIRTSGAPFTGLKERSEHNT